MKQAATRPSIRTYLVECFGGGSLPAASAFEGVPVAFLATLAIAEDEQMLVLLRGLDAETAARECVAAGLTVDRVVEVVLSPAWRWVRDPSRADRR